MPYLTPDIPVGSKTVTLTIPDTLTPSVMGGLVDLLDPENWEDFGALTSEQAAQLMNDVVDSWTVGAPMAFPPFVGFECVVSGEELVAPYNMYAPQWANPTLENGVSIANYDPGTLVVDPDKGGVYAISFYGTANYYGEVGMIWANINVSVPSNWAGSSTYSVSEGGDVPFFVTITAPVNGGETIQVSLFNYSGSTVAWKWSRVSVVKIAELPVG